MTRRIYRFLLAALIVYWLAIFTLTHIPAVRLPRVHINDKIEHFGAFTLLSILLNVVLGTRIKTNRDWLTILIVLVYGALDEWLQTPVGRDCDLRDWFADGTGAAVGVALCGLCRYIRLHIKTAGHLAAKPEAEKTPSSVE